MGRAVVFTSLDDLAGRAAPMELLRTAVSALSGGRVRIAGTLGLYGFQLLLPVPRASMDFYVGKPSQTVQFKGGIGGFYDVAVGGHGGVNGELGVVLRNRVDISFMAVPFGTDSKRSYAEFMGIKSQEEADKDYKKAGNRWVEMPYYGIFVGLRF